MQQERVARRYARAFFNVALHTGRVEEMRQALERLQTVVHEHPRLLDLLHNPLIPREYKDRVLAQALQDRLPDLVVGLARVLVQKRREMYLDAVAAEFIELYDEHLGEVRAEVISARPIDPAQLDALRQALEQRLQRTVLIHTTIDPAQIGGVAVRIGDTVIDGTLRGRLSRLRHDMMIGTGM